MISLIVAVAKNNVIGNNGVIPWKIKGEQKRFKELTTGKTIIMGRKAFEEKANHYRIERQYLYQTHRKLRQRIAQR